MFSLYSSNTSLRNLILGFRQVQAEPEPDHTGYHGQRLRRTTLVLRRLIGLLGVLLSAELRPRQGLFRSVLPEVDAAAKPVVIPLAPFEILDSNYDPERCGQTGTMIAYDRPVVVVEPGH